MRVENERSGAARWPGACRQGRWRARCQAEVPAGGGDGGGGRRGQERVDSSSSAWPALAMQMDIAPQRGTLAGARPAPGLAAQADSERCTELLREAERFSGRRHRVGPPGRQRHLGSAAAAAPCSAVAPLPLAHWRPPFRCYSCAAAAAAGAAGSFSPTIPIIYRLPRPRCRRRCLLSRLARGWVCRAHSTERWGERPWHRPSRPIPSKNLHMLCS